MRSKMSNNAKVYDAFPQSDILGLVPDPENDLRLGFGALSLADTATSLILDVAVSNGKIGCVHERLPPFDFTPSNPYEPAIASFWQWKEIKARQSPDEWCVRRPRLRSFFAGTR